MSKLIDQKIARNFIRLRRQSKLTQKQVAEYLGCHRINVIRMEKGQNGFTATNLYNLCMLFKCPITELFPAINRKANNTNKSE